MKSKVNKKVKTTNKVSKADEGADFCGLKSDEGQEEMMSKYIEETAGKSTDELDYSFCGMKSKEGKLKMRSKYNIKKQAIMHSLTLKQEKRKKRLLKRQQEIRREKIAARKEVKTKQIRKKVDLDEVKLNKLIQDYQSETVTSYRKKWYED